MRSKQCPHQHQVWSCKVSSSVFLNKREQPELIYQSFALCGIWLGIRHTEAGFGILLSRGSELWQRLGRGAWRAGGGACPWGGGVGVFTCTAGAAGAATKSPRPPELNPWPPQQCWACTSSIVQP